MTLVSDDLKQRPKGNTRYLGNRGKMSSLSNAGNVVGVK